MSRSLTSIERFERELKACWARSDALFERVPHESLLDRPIQLRHPILFYMGHLPAFMWNQVGAGALGLGPLDAELDGLFERGIDPHDQGAARAASIQAWPKLSAVHAYCDRARERILSLIPRVLATPGELCEKGRVLHLCLEHERMHHETLLYMFQEHPGLLALGEQPELGDGVSPTLVHIPAGETRIGARWEDQDFGWDNEFSIHTQHIPSFELDSHPVRVIDFAEFVDSGAWMDDRYWDAQDLSWRPEHPGSWVPSEQGWRIKWIFGQVPIANASGWPAQVSYAAATAYARWKGTRLPTEGELNRAAYATPQGDWRAYPWGEQTPGPEHGRLNFERWSPAPVGSHPAGASAWGVHELVGNGWEWTASRFGPLPGFRPWMSTYPGYSADFFDNWHQVVFGGSWATHPSLVRRSFRNWYQRRYPFVFSSFRLVR